MNDLWEDFEQAAESQPLLSQPLSWWPADLDELLHWASECPREAGSADALSKETASLLSSFLASGCFCHYCASMGSFIEILAAVTRERWYLGSGRKDFGGSRGDQVSQKLVSAWLCVRGPKVLPELRRKIPQDPFTQGV